MYHMLSFQNFLTDYPPIKWLKRINHKLKHNKDAQNNENNAQLFIRFQKLSVLRQNLDWLRHRISYFE